MLFDMRPKTKRADMYGRDEEIDRLHKYIRLGVPGIVIKGHRRMGKTSILQTVLHANKDPYILVDMRDLGSSGTITRKDIVVKFQSGVNEFLSRNKTKKQSLIESLKIVSGVTVMGTGVRFGWQRGEEVLDLAQALRKINEWAEANDKTVVMAIDEAQILGRSKHYDVSGILAAIYDSCRNIVIVLSGSAFRLLDEFMAMNDPNSYLFGRDFKVIRVTRLTKDQSKDLLRKGFEETGDDLESNQDFDGIIGEAAATLGGIIGWLVMFGDRCSTNGSITKNDIVEIQRQGAELAGQEFNSFLDNRRGAKRYRSIMEYVASSQRTWTEIRDMLTKNEPCISDSNVSLLLDNLYKNGFLEYESNGDKKYTIPDPLLAFFFMQQ